MVNLLIIKEDQKTPQLDFKKSLFKQINLLRIVDNENYPAFFSMRKKYLIKIFKEKKIIALIK